MRTHGITARGNARVTRSPLPERRVGRVLRMLSLAPKHAPESIDVDAEAARFATWARQVLGVAVTAAQVRALLLDVGDAAAADDVLEETVERLVNLLGLPLSDELRLDCRFLTAALRR